MADQIDIELVPEVTQQTLQTLSNEITKALQGAIAKALQQAEGEAGVRGGGPAGPSGSAAAATLSGMLEPLNKIRDIVDAIASFVAVANPAVVEQLTRTMNDVFGVIGQTLTPVLEAVIPIVRMFGDILASILPTQNQINDVLKSYLPLIDAFVSIARPIVSIIQAIVAVLIPFQKLMNLAFFWPLKLITPILDAIAPLFEAFAEIIGALAEPLNELVDLLGDTFTDVIKSIMSVIADFIKIIVDAIRSVAKWLGIKATDRRSSVGAAAGGAETVGVADLSRKMIVGALGMSSAQTRTADAVESIDRKVDRIGRKLNANDPAFKGN